MPPPPAQKPATTQSSEFKNKVKRRSSKPIITWFQRKLAGTVTKKGPGAESSRPGLGDTTNSVSQRPKSSQQQQLGKTRSRKAEESKQQPPAAISLNGDTDDESMRRSSRSLAPESTWSPSSPIEADEDASIRPLPPTSPPSPSPSRSSSSYLSDPRTFKSMAASTKPTTLLSIDLTTNGMAHIAQAPSTPPPSRLPPHIRTTSSPILGSGTSITFSALPPSPQASPNRGGGTQAPLHTSHHPRNNPRPSSPPSDDASMLTLASSAFAAPGGRMGGWIAGDSVSHIGGGESMTHFVYSDDGLAEVDRDVDASMRALRPRSSRQGSFETFDSQMSRWSAKVAGGGGGRERGSLLTGTAYSFRTGGQQTMDDDMTDEGYGDVTSPSIERTVESFKDMQLGSSQEQEQEGLTSEDITPPGQEGQPLRLELPDRNGPATVSADEVSFTSVEASPSLPRVELTPKSKKGWVSSDVGITEEERSTEDKIPIPQSLNAEGGSDDVDGGSPGPARKETSTSISERIVDKSATPIEESGADHQS